MKRPPADPYAFQARAFGALLADIADPKAKSFPRLDALRSVSISMRGGECAKNGSPVDR